MNLTRSNKRKRCNTGVNAVKKPPPLAVVAVVKLEVASNNADVPNTSEWQRWLSNGHAHGRSLVFPARMVEHLNI
jgi:hypothetical protein